MDKKKTPRQQLDELKQNALKVKEGLKPGLDELKKRTRKTRDAIREALGLRNKK